MLLPAKAKEFPPFIATESHVCNTGNLAQCTCATHSTMCVEQKKKTQKRRERGNG